jgi:hypothetical protein
LRSLLDTEYAFADSLDKVERYPALADLSGSGDLGFTAGPWIHTVSPGGMSHGHFLTIWKRDAACRWQIECGAGVSHAAPASAEPKLSPSQASYAPRSAPLPSLIADHALDLSMQDFQNTARQDGIAPALRTYARTADFLLYTDGEAPLELAAANRFFLIAHFPACGRRTSIGALPMPVSRIPWACSAARTDGAAMPMYKSGSTLPKSPIGDCGCC